MSSPKSESEHLKGGHPPAVKAGGMRITQHKTQKSDDKPLLEEPDINNAGLKISTSPPKTLTISGAPSRGNADFPAEAVKSYQEKPLPCHDPRPAHGNRQNIIHQPKKQ